MKIIRKILKNIKRSMLKSNLERYLDQAQNIADLEDRMKRWDRKQQRANSVFGRM